MREIDTLLARYASAIVAQINAAREHLKLHHVPRGYELVYDNYNTLAFGYAPSERASDAQISLAAYPRWVTLFFLHGAALPDPDGLLEGRGVRVRSVRLAPESVLHAPPVQALLRAALAGRASDFAAAPPMTTVLKSVSARQRPRRPTS